MATIQIRNVPEEVHRVHRRRAADAGMSLQEYLRADLIRGAETKTTAEIVRQARARIEARPQDYPEGSSAPFIRADRDSH